MNFCLLNIVLSLILSAYLAGFVIPQILLIAFRKNLFDEPDERKIHTSLVPRLGGLAFTPVIFLTLSFLVGINTSCGFDAILNDAAGSLQSLSYLICAVILLYLVGIGDDLIGIRYKAKFFVQIVCGILLLAGGVYLKHFQGFCGIGSLPLVFAYPFTILLVVFVINAVNLIDGIDGLASGLSSVAFLFYGIIFYLMHHYTDALLSFSALGVLVPFFYYNVFGDAEKHKKIFMGDTGSLTIGMLLCFLSLRLSMIDKYDFNYSLNPLALAYSPLIIPCLDVIRVYMGRVKKGKNPFLPDKTHIHHKLLAVGMQQRMAMVTIILVSILFTLINIVLSPYLNITFLLVFDISIWTLGNIWLTRKEKRMCENKD